MPFLTYRTAPSTTELLGITSPVGGLRQDRLYSAVSETLFIYLQRSRTLDTVLPRRADNVIALLGFWLAAISTPATRTT
jgi:hypothetical protein